jgi:hypothetical protein
MFSVNVVCILAIWAFNCSGFALVSAGVAAADVAVTVAPGVAVTVTAGAGAGVAAGWGVGAGVTVTVGMGVGAGVGAAFWARTGIHIRESATIDAWTGLIRFMGVLLDRIVLLTVGEVYPLGVLKARDRSGSRLVQEALSRRRATTALSAVL